MCSETFERATFNDNRFRSQYSCIHHKQRNRIKQRSIARQTGYINIDFIELFTKVKGRLDIKAI